METALGLISEETAAGSGDEQRRDALAERLFASLLGGIELLSVDPKRHIRLSKVKSRSSREEEWETR